MQRGTKEKSKGVQMKRIRGYKLKEVKLTRISISLANMCVIASPIFTFLLSYYEIFLFFHFYFNNNNKSNNNGDDKGDKYIIISARNTVEKFMFFCLF